MTFEQARKKAKAVLGAAANGNDPSAVRAAKRREMLISELRDLYEKVGCVIQRGKRIGQPMKALTKQYRSEEHTSELQSLMRSSYAVFCLKKKNSIAH